VLYPLYLMSKANEDRLEKTRFVTEQAQARLTAIVDAYEGMTTKAFTLLTIAVPIFAALAGFCILQFDLSSPAFYAALGYAGVLIPCAIILWQVIRVRPIFHPGRRPKEYAKPNIASWSLQRLLDEECVWFDREIEENKQELDRASGLVKRAMALFLIAPLLGFTVLIICTSIKFFSQSEAVLRRCTFHQSGEPIRHFYR
jgi:hypothetical protein